MIQTRLGINGPILREDSPREDFRRRGNGMELTGRVLKVEMDPDTNRIMYVGIALNRGKGDMELVLHSDDAAQFVLGAEVRVHISTGGVK